MVTAAPGPTPHDVIRDRSIRLFTFLRELMELRTKTVRAVDQYEKVLWLDEIPKENGCFCAAWNAGSEQESESWLQIQRPRLPEPPIPPEVLRPWIAEPELQNSNQPPKLCPVIPIQVHDDVTDEIRTEYRRLADHPEVVRTWNLYLHDEWQPWAEVDRRLKRILSVYTDLFSLYQRQQRLGEAYEVVLGLGYLSWRTPSGQNIRRHLITAQTALSFDAVRGVMSVGPAGQGARPELEQDMLEAGERPDAKELVAIEMLVAKSADDIWEGTHIFAALEAWAHAVTPSGESNREIQRKEATGSRPIVSFAPALILRKRTERSLIRIFKEIAEQLKKGTEIPLGVQRIVAILDDVDGNVEAQDGRPGATSAVQEIYFPDLANTEQLEIVRKLASRQGILVQGPPGTGKSHTIANLVAHLLAEGQRVLVTSHTARALRVLKDKIAPEISNLCVLVLGDDLSAMQSLEDSVRGINEKYDHWDEQANRRLIADLERDLDQARRAEADALGRFRAIRESETYHHSAVCGNYSGTAQKIAQQLRSEERRYGWLGIQVPKSLEPPLTNEEILECVRLLRRLDSAQAKSDLCTRPIGADLLVSPQCLSELIRNERDAAEKYEAVANLRSTALYSALSRLPAGIRGALRSELDTFLAVFETASAAPDNWQRQALLEIVSGQVTPWLELLRITKEKLAAIQDSIQKAGQFQISGLEGRDLALVRAHAENLLRHLTERKWMGFGPLRPAVVKSGEYLIKEVVVDGQLCCQVAAISKLLVWIQVEEQLRAIQRDWPSSIQFPRTSPAIRKAYIEGLLETLNTLLALGGTVQRIKGLLTGAAVEPNWRDADDVRKFRTVLDAVSAEHIWNEAAAPLRELEKCIYSETLYGNCHPALREILECIRQRHIDGYASAYERLAEVCKLRAQESVLHQLLRKLRNVSPRVADRIQSEFQNERWEAWSRTFVEAWNWSRCSSWLAEVTDSRAGTRVANEIDMQRTRIRECVRSIAAAKAWGHCFAPIRLREEQRQHLRAWATAVRRIGRGTGKHANLHRQAAREHMQYCRPAIPAWIMPIFRVADTVQPSPGAFDVVIVDEASQSGPEALFLLYLANKMVVVGDDKQISPDFIGLDHDDVNLLRQRRIADLPHVDALGVENSFFDIAAIRYSGRIRLREHFRCMPEIIQFSNNLCYSSEPLVPLRQYGIDRLTPTVGTVHVPDGYQKGSSPRIINPPEATALVSKVAQCCADPRYKDKTIGVISLLGEDQARYIEKLLLESVGPDEMEKRKMACGDAYAFQGDERDVIFLSMVSAPTEGHRIGTLASPKDERRFNVAVSRARDQLWLVHTATLNDLSPACLRYKLLQYCENPHVEQSPVRGWDLARLRLLAASEDRETDKPPDPFESWFELDVFLDIADRGFRIIPQMSIAGYSIDLVIEGMKGRIAVECDGDRWHGIERLSEDMARQRRLERCGWTFWRVRGSEYYREPGAAMAPLWRLLQQIGITPTVAQPAVAEISEVSSRDSNAERIESTPHNQSEERAEPALSNETVVPILLRCVPLERRIPREELLTIVAHELGLPRITREVRHVLNSAISEQVRNGVLRVDHNWDHVWQSEQMRLS